MINALGPENLENSGNFYIFSKENMIADLFGDFLKFSVDFDSKTVKFVKSSQHRQQALPHLSNNDGYSIEKRIQGETNLAISLNNFDLEVEQSMIFRNFPIDILHAYSRCVALDKKYALMWSNPDYEEDFEMILINFERREVTNIKHQLTAIVVYDLSNQHICLDQDNLKISVIMDESLFELDFSFLLETD